MEMLTACRIESLEIRLCVDEITVSPTALLQLDDHLQEVVTHRWRRWKR